MVVVAVVLVGGNDNTGMSHRANWRFARSIDRGRGSTTVCFFFRFCFFFFDHTEFSRKSRSGNSVRSTDGPLSQRQNTTVFSHLHTHKHVITYIPSGWELIFVVLVGGNRGLGYVVVVVVMLVMVVMVVVVVVVVVAIIAQ